MDLEAIEAYRQKQSEQAGVQKQDDQHQELTSSLNNLLLATMVSKDPKMVEVAQNLGALLNQIGEASAQFGRSNLQLLPFANQELAASVMDLSSKIQEYSPHDLEPYFATLTRQLNMIAGRTPVVNVPEQPVTVNLDPLIKALTEVKAEVKKNKVDIPKTDMSEVIKGLKDVSKTINSLQFPVANYVLPFKDINGKATQVQLDADGKIPTSGGGSGGGDASAANQTSGAQKTQIVDAGGDVATVTGGKLDVNASIDTTGLATTLTDTNTTAIKTAVEILDNAVSGSEMQVDVVAALPAGNNNIGDVDVASVAGTVSTNNSSTSVLAGAAAFTGTADEITNVGAIRVSVFASHVSATDGLSLQQSSNGTNWDITDTYTIPATTGRVFVVNPVARYFRIVYTNGATLQTSFRLQTIYSPLATIASSQRPSDAYTNEVDAEQMISLNSIYNGTTWDRMRGDTTNGVDVDVTRLPTLANVTTVATVTNVATIGTSVTPGTAAANLGKARDAVAGASDVGTSTLFVRRDTPTAVTPAAGDYEVPQIDSTGSQWVREKPSTTSALTNVSGSASSVTVLALNAQRRGAIIYNDSTVVLYLKLGATASATSFTYKMQPDSTVEIPFGYTGVIDGIWASATGSARVTEIT